MRGFASYLVAGILVVLAMDFAAPPAGLGLARGAWPAGEPVPVARMVVRAHKGDRLPMLPTSGKLPVQQKAPAMLVGCDPMFSPLSASAKVNSPGRCIV